MKKNSPLYDNEIDLVELLKIFWDGKIKIIIITIILFIMFVGYNQQRPNPEPNSYKNSLAIKPTRNSEFFKFLPVYNFLNEDNLVQLSHTGQSLQFNNGRGRLLEINGTSLIDKFVNEILDFEELISVLRNNEHVKKKISNLSEKDKLIKLYEYARLFTIESQNDEKNNKFNNYLITFIWSNPEESKEIIDQTIKLALINLERSIFNEIEDMLEVKKILILNDDLKRVEYLLEQSLIAKELNLADNQVDNVNLSHQSNVSFNINTNEVAYYLRGYKAIDKEISIIKKRKYKRFSNIKKKIDELKSTKVEWINYSIFLLETKIIKKQNNSNLPLHLSIIFGLIIGSFYVFISHVFQSKKKH